MAPDAVTCITKASSSPRLVNGVDPNDNAVEYGTTPFNLFIYDPSTSSGTYLASTISLTVTAIPAPASMLAFALLPAARRRRR